MADTISPLALRMGLSEEDKPKFFKPKKNEYDHEEAVKRPVRVREERLRSGSKEVRPVDSKEKAKVNDPYYRKVGKKTHYKVNPPSSPRMTVTDRHNARLRERNREAYDRLYLQLLNRSMNEPDMDFEAELDKLVQGIGPVI
jgi:hypothetical protein